MMEEGIELQGMVPDRLNVRQSRILLDSLEVMTDIGFHEFEVGSPQRLTRITNPRGTTTIFEARWCGLPNGAVTTFRKRWFTRYFKGLPPIEE